MNAKIALAAGMAAILAAVLAIPSQAAFAATVNITIVPGASTKTNDAFSPNPAQANVGDTVIWTNKDGALHTVESGSGGTPDGKFGEKPDGTPVLIPPTKTLEFKPTEAGEYPYFCSLHPAMVGTLTVAAAGGSTGGNGTATMQEGTATAQLDGKSYTVTSKSATSKVTAATITAGESVNVAFDKAGEMEVTLPKAMIDGIQSVTANGQTVQFTSTNSTDSTTIKFTAPAGATSVDITGTMVVPEFGVIAALVLAASLVAVIGVARFKGQAFGFRL
ncbi:cupredoxin domain-containing protein [Nitrososphaera viennensis]|uniref:Cupredoxin domain-containing protein n=2 Tax=Nitrososphaera viennensis TaxID=1034015 RepID=A0A977NNH9_9ARCH|nr:cupredoxin domain-containing protein [Nitrososphaera viennensis]AIC15678.1 putative Copper binding protein, plastocyanin/azurin family [Nitrososphaera viennensis EN76]UVS70551.1 cupredoxin domain-containing protein [Nitrososphaera viennensis]